MSLSFRNGLASDPQLLVQRILTRGVNQMASRYPRARILLHLLQGNLLHMALLQHQKGHWDFTELVEQIMILFYLCLITDVFMCASISLQCGKKVKGERLILTYFQLSGPPISTKKNLRTVHNLNNWVWCLSWMRRRQPFRN